MLSVCIPVYRYHAVPLAQTLLRQVAADDLSAVVEILLYDDASPEDGDWGRATLRSLPGIRYVELAHNLGRAAIRNRMARDARWDYCLFLDVDAALPADYLAAYLNYLKGLRVPAAEHLVVVGGRRYADLPPEDPQLQLHWWYGRQRESDVDYGAAQGWLGFHSNNFVVSRQLVLQHPFPEAVAGYGHEDTLWGQHFVGTNVQLHRIPNAVVHLGLEPNDAFLRKQHQAIRNLHRLHRQTPHPRTRLTDLVTRYPRLTRLARILPEQILLNYLRRRARPNLIVLDLLKLKWWYAENGD